MKLLVLFIALLSFTPFTSVAEECPPVVKEVVGTMKARISETKAVNTDFGKGYPCNVYEVYAAGGWAYQLIEEELLTKVENIKKHQMFKVWIKIDEP